jgi:hypothetical protein
MTNALAFALRGAVPLMLATLATMPAQAAPVLLNVSNSGSPSQSYFGSPPDPWATVAIEASSEAWSLVSGVAKQVRYGWTSNETGPTGGCCTAQTRSFAFGLSVAGVTQQISVDIQAMQVNNDQFQFDTLDRPDVFLDLGSIGRLRLDFLPSASQMPANLGGGVALFARATLTAPAQAVPVAGSLWLAGLGLALAAVPSLRTRPGRA